MCKKLLDWLKKKKPVVTDEFKYDYVVEGDYDEIDLLYTTDTHLAWLGGETEKYKCSSEFYLNDIANYKDKLWNAGIPTFCVDCGDWSHGGENDVDEIISLFNNCGKVGYKKYLAVTYGNHEWYTNINEGDGNKTKALMDKIDNLTACNLFDVDYNLIYKPWRAIKVGNKKIGIIAIGYPSPNGGNNYDEYGHEVLFKDGSGKCRWTLDEDYRWYDTTDELDYQTNGTAIDKNEKNMYNQVQTYIDMFKENNFDYIIAMGHLDTYEKEDYDADNRFYSRADLLIKNTSGLNIVIPGHWNYPVEASIVEDKDGAKVKIVEECGAGFHNIGRLRLKPNGEIVSYLLDEQSDLNNI